MLLPSDELSYLQALIAFSPIEWQRELYEMDFMTVEKWFLDNKKWLRPYISVVSVCSITGEAHIRFSQAISFYVPERVFVFDIDESYTVYYPEIYRLIREIYYADFR